MMNAKHPIALFRTPDMEDETLSSLLTRMMLARWSRPYGDKTTIAYTEVIRHIERMTGVTVGKSTLSDAVDGIKPTSHPILKLIGDSLGIHVADLIELQEKSFADRRKKA
jgi:hypothetical protein